MISRRLSCGKSKDIPETERIADAPGDAALAVDAFEVAHQKGAKVDPGCEARTAHLACVELCAEVLRVPIEGFVVRLPIQLAIERVAL